MIWFDLRQRVTTFAQYSLPALITLLLLLVTLIPWHSFSLPLAGMFTTASIFYWEFHRPEVMPPWVAAAIGLFSDFLGISPIGVGMASALVAWWLAGWIRRGTVRPAPLLKTWGAFALINLFVQSLAWLLAAIASAGWYNFSGVLIEILISIAAYPALAYLLTKADQVVFR